MGGFLDRPVTEKDSGAGTCRNGSVAFVYGAMQGWREGMEVRVGCPVCVSSRSDVLKYS